ncbi:hypothetical protein RHOFW104R3_21645 [Rhodanobacter denitrificans]|nr:hypothetical protein UUA_07315 [Rhodanobacter thiooxydans LCS2]KZC21263.1 hypothetical protein RHOFW104R3_21645 [Rhodanobacter denitrificans]
MPDAFQKANGFAAQWFLQFSGIHIRTFKHDMATISPNCFSQTLQPLPFLQPLLQFITWLILVHANSVCLTRL